MKAKYLIKGIIKSIHGIEYLYHFNKSMGGTCSAMYCYSIWLRHLILAYQNGFTSIPKTVAELGPDDSSAIGLATVISGANEYYALDVKRFSNEDVNLKAFDELVDLFKQKENIPDEYEFPRVKPLLKDDSFPEHISSDECLREILDERRLSAIRKAIEALNAPDTADDKMIEYRVPFMNKITHLIVLRTFRTVI